MQRQQLARATGVDAETIRYYERIGLLPAPARRANGYREYTAQHLERLAFVRHCRALDLPLETVARLLVRLDEPAADCGDVDGLVAEQLARVRARLASMVALEQQLLRLQACCDGQHDVAHCGILQALVHAAAGEACACHPAGEVKADTAAASPRAQSGVAGAGASRSSTASRSARGNAARRRTSP